jgi:hypothetical protein
VWTGVGLGVIVVVVLFMLPSANRTKLPPKFVKRH